MRHVASTGVVLLLLGFEQIHAARYSALYVFGANLEEIGNNKNFANRDGRYEGDGQTNGKVYVEVLAERLGTRCITNSPVCAPARVALATGRRPNRIGAVSNGAYVPHDCETFYQRFRACGYEVACRGKLHLTPNKDLIGRYGDTPFVYGLGFTDPVECEGKEHARSKPEPFGPYTHFLEECGLFETFVERGGSALPAEAFEDAFIGARAREWIEQVPGDRPWLMFVSFVGPHNPYDPPEPYGNKYSDLTMPEPILDDMKGKPRWVQEKAKNYNTNPEEMQEARRGYCGAIELIDDQVGEILEGVDGRGWTDKTYVVFVSDHGDMLGDHGLFTKSVAYESAIRVPLIVAGPGIEGDRTSDAIVELIDVNPTVCELAGVGVSDCIDARSFSGVLFGERTEHRTDVLSTLLNFNCLRTDRHKVIQNFNDLTELYDLDEDPDELVNIASDQPEPVRDLSELMVRRYYGN